MKEKRSHSYALLVPQWREFLLVEARDYRRVVSNQPSLPPVR
jgi:hypothetical protein